MSAKMNTISVCLLAHILMTIISAAKIPNPRLLTPPTSLADVERHLAQIKQAGGAKAAENAPNIGILTQPAKGRWRKLGFKSMIPASYAEWIEQLGANAIPIPYTLRKREIKALMHQVNGLLLPGGGTPVFKKHGWEFYKDRVYYSLDIARELNQNGVHFPVWGTCMGFEQIINWASGYTIWPTKVGNYHIDRRIHWNHKVLPKTFLAKNLTEKQLKDLQNEPISYFNHKWAISRKDFDNNAHLSRDVLPVSDTYSIEGEDFVSTIEGNGWPLFGTQYHPEKVQFEHVKPNEGMNIGSLAVDSAIMLGNVFVNEAKKNLKKNKFECKKLLKKLMIQNFSHVFTDSVFETVYFFTNKELNFVDLLLNVDGCMD